MSVKNQKFIEECFEQHNIFRRLHCVRELVYSQYLQTTAQEHADFLKNKDHLENSQRAKDGEVGENLSVRSNTAKKFTITGGEIAQQWYDTIKNYNFETADGQAGNFTQLIWASTTEVGFGISHIKGKYTVVAHYSPPGNVRGHYTTNVFPLGTPSLAIVDPAEPIVNEDINLFYSKETDDTATVNVTGETCQVFKSSCFKTDIRCDIEDPSLASPLIQWTDDLKPFESYLSHLRTDSMSSDESFEYGLIGIPDLCKARRRKIRQFVRETIASINRYRVLHGVPILKHNKDLDELSQSWAEQLIQHETLSHSDAEFKGAKIGESIASRWSNMKVEYNAGEVAEHFYAEKHKYNFNEEHNSLDGFGNFTQMLWKSTTEIGIGKAYICHDKNFKVVVVCSYYPAGNVVGKFMENVLPLPQFEQ